MTPQEYDAAERAAMKTLPNRAIQASQPLVFEYVGYPTRIDGLDELWRFADVMQEGRIEDTFTHLGGLTENEFELVKKVTDKVRNLVGVTPGPGLIRAIPVYRAIRDRIGSGGVFELGAGSGMVGALLQADGKYRYQCSDISQAFALWQIMLLGRDAFVPWWEWMGDRELPKVRGFTANHMLNEMSHIALIHAATRVRKMLEGYFLVEDYGSHTFRKDEGTIGILRDYGLDPITIKPEPGRKNPVTWQMMLDYWGGSFPESADEKFMMGLEPPESA